MLRDRQISRATQYDQLSGRSLRQQVMRSASCLPMVLSPNTADRDDIYCLRLTTSKR